MARNGRIFSPKYTPKLAPSPTVVPPREKVVPTLLPQARASFPTTPVVTTVPSIIKGTTRKIADVETSKGKEIVNERE